LALAQPTKGGSGCEIKDPEGLVGRGERIYKRMAGERLNRSSGRKSCCSSPPAFKKSLGGGGGTENRDRAARSKGGVSPRLVGERPLGKDAAGELRRNERVNNVPARGVTYRTDREKLDLLNGTPSSVCAIEGRKIRKAITVWGGTARQLLLSNETVLTWGFWS